MIPNKSLSVYEDAIVCWKGEKMSRWKEKLLLNASQFDFPVHKPYYQLTEEQKIAVTATLVALSSQPPCVSMGNPHCVVFVEEATDSAAPAILTALEDWAPGDAQIIVTAGQLKASSKLRKAFEAQTLRDAFYDAVTGLPNRVLLQDRLEQAIQIMKRNNSSMALLLLDLDRFKSVNETLGHDVGDDLLRQVAGRLRDNLRVGDFAGRWRGDEFVVCLEDFGEAGNAAAAAQKLLLVLSEKYQVGNSEVYATPSIGIAVYPASGNNAERMIKAADIAMYEAKRAGKGQDLWLHRGIATQCQ